jgi:hypothetical protein
MIITLGYLTELTPPKKKKKTIAKFQVPALYLLAMYSQKVKLKIKSAKTK